MRAPIFFVTMVLASAQAIVLDEEAPKIMDIGNQNPGLAYFTVMIAPPSRPAITTTWARPPERCNLLYYDASIHDIPYIVFLETDQGPCTGAILSNEWIVTTSRCIDHGPPDKYKIRAGSDMKNGGRIHTIDKVFKHEYFHVQGGVPMYNVALVKIKEPFIFDETHFPVHLPPQNEVLDTGKTVTVTGIRENVSILRSSDVPAYDLHECEKAYSYNLHRSAQTSFLCLGYNYPQTKKCLCEVRPGDLVTSDGKLVGLMSVRPHCYDDNNWKPALAMNISYFRDWIMSKIS